MSNISSRIDRLERDTLPRNGRMIYYWRPQNYSDDAMRAYLNETTGPISDRDLLMEFEREEGRPAEIMSVSNLEKASSRKAGDGPTRIVFSLEDQRL